MAIYNQINLDVAKIASKDGLRPALNGVLFTNDKTVATDSFKLIEISTPKDDELKDINIQNRQDFGPFIVNAKQLSTMKIKKIKAAPALEHAIIKQQDEGTILLSNLSTNSNQEFRTVQESYPEYETIIPKEFCAEIIINGEYLKDLLSILSKLDETQQVTLKIAKDEKMIMLEAGTTQKGRALLMAIHK